MHDLKTNPFIVPAKWVLDLTKMTVKETLDGLSDIYEIDIASTCMSIELSDDPDRLMSAFGALWFIYSRDRSSRDTLKELVNTLDDMRWREMVRARTDVMRECIRLFSWLESKPTFIPLIADTIAEDQTSVDLLCETWIEKDWDLSGGVVFVLQHSSLTWKFIDAFNETGHCSSRDVLKNLTRQAMFEEDLWFDMMTLLGTSTSAIQYPLHIDEKNDGGISSTIGTINKFGLWEVIFHNSAANEIIDYIMDFPELVSDENLGTYGSVGEWIIHMLEMSPLIVEYASYKDLKRFSNTVYYNPFALDLIYLSIDMRCIPDNIIDGLISIAIHGSSEIAFRALDMLEFGFNTRDEPVLKGIGREEWSMLLRGAHTRDFAILTLEEMNEYAILDELMRDLELIPYWVESEDGSWSVRNLDLDTVVNLSERFCSELKELPYLLSFSNWSVLFKTRFGVKLGMHNISYVIEQGAVFELLRSPLITKEEIVELGDFTDLFEYCDDEDFAALISRDDAFEVDLKKIGHVNHSMCQELLEVWHDPIRLSRIANALEMPVYEYLQLV